MTAITVITASMPGRASLLAETVQSVADQTVAPFAHLIRIQAPPKLGPAHSCANHNALLGMVETEWLAGIDDDDLLLPNHIQVLSDAISSWGQIDSTVDLIYTWPQEDCGVPRVDVTEWPQDELIRVLMCGNMIPATVAMR